MANFSFFTTDTPEISFETAKEFMQHKGLKIFEPGEGWYPEPEMVFYKMFSPNMTCIDKQYKENAIYEEKGGVICNSGMMHFCKRISDCLEYYPLLSECRDHPSCKAHVLVPRELYENRVAIVRPLGTIVLDDDPLKCPKYATNKLQILNCLTMDEVFSILCKEAHEQVLADVFPYKAFPANIKTLFGDRGRMHMFPHPEYPSETSPSLLFEHGIYNLLTSEADGIEIISHGHSFTSFIKARRTSQRLYGLGGSCYVVGDGNVIDIQGDDAHVMIIGNGNTVKCSATGATVKITGDVNEVEFRPGCVNMKLSIDGRGSVCTDRYDPWSGGWKNYDGEWMTLNYFDLDVQEKKTT